VNKYPRRWKPPAAETRGRARLVKYQEPKQGFRGFLRRWLRRLTRPVVLVPIGIVAAVVITVLVYYWTIFSQRIDQLLNGDVFTRTAGIYAAPKMLHAGQEITVEELVVYLKAANYVEKSQQGDAARGRYRVQDLAASNFAPPPGKPKPAAKPKPDGAAAPAQRASGYKSGAVVEVEPSNDAIVDGQKVFHPLRIQFGAGGTMIASLGDLVSHAPFQTAELEPQLISSVAGQDRSKRRVIGFQDLPPHLIKAITTTEDRSFFEHWGINVRGIARAFFRRYDADPNSPISNQGGSSITQQLVKNLLLSPERTWKRKASEAYMSVILETRLSKQEIFALYCNQVYLGQQAGFSVNGFGEAAESYFGKDVSTITLPEAAFLAGIIRSPNRYNPYRDLNTATQRRNQVLDSMAETGAITTQAAADAKASPLKVVAAKTRIDLSDAPYFADYVQNNLAEIIPDSGMTQHLRVYTTLDMDLQRAAVNSVNKQLDLLDKVVAKRGVEPGTLQASLVAMNVKTGDIIAMVGGRDYTKSQLNRATDAMRQPGSVFKPFVYATALNTAYDPVPRVITAADVFKDEPKTFFYEGQTYSPGNFGDRYTNGPLTLRDALVNSKNVITVEVAMDVTIGRVMALAAKAGLPHVDKAYPAMALGASEATPLQIASAYTAFADNGSRITPVGINRVTTGTGTTVATPTGQRNEVLRPDVAYLMTDLLKDVVNRGTAAKLNSRGFHNEAGKTGFAGKTGTSRDGWFAGFTPSIVCVVYVGFDDGSQLGITGADAALPIWADFMTAALAEHPEWNGDWQRPESIQEAEIDIRTGVVIGTPAADGSTEPAPPPDVPYDPDNQPQPQPTATATPTVSSEVPAEFRRKELFISGTVPGGVRPPLPEDGTEAPPVPDITPYDPDLEPSPAVPDDQGVPAPRSTSRNVTIENGTVTVDIDPTTGLLAASTCPVIRTKTYIIGKEPHQYCGPQYHGGVAPAVREERPRKASP
jgi:penicillin-binding protein 1B